MAREGISYEQVAATADALVGAGEQPSIRAVREALGTGSPNTIHRHLGTWRAARPVAQTAAYELPAELVNGFGRELARVASQARAEVEQDLVRAQAEAAELASTGEALEAERDELAAQVAALTSERDQAQATAVERAQEIQRLGDQVQREQAAAEAARIDLATARLKGDGLAEQLAELREQLTAARQTLEAAQAGRQQAEQQAAVLTAQEAAQRARSDDLVGRLAYAEKTAQGAREAAEKANREATNARIAEQAAQARLESSAREIDGAKAVAKEAKAEAAELRRLLMVSQKGEKRSPATAAKTAKAVEE